MGLAPDFSTSTVQSATPAVQLCLVPMVRHSLNFVGWKQRKEVAADLRLIYSAATEDEALLRLSEFEEKWNASFPPIGQSWRRNWARLRPYQLVGARLNGDVAERAEWPTASAQLQAQGIAQEQGGGMVASLVRVGPGKGGRLNRGKLQLRN